MHIFSHSPVEPIAEPLRHVVPGDLLYFPIMLCGLPAAQPSPGLLPRPALPRPQPGPAKLCFHTITGDREVKST